MSQAEIINRINVLGKKVESNQYLLQAIWEVINGEQISRETVAAITGYSTEYIKNLVKANKIPSHKIKGRRVFFASEIKEWYFRKKD